MFAFLEVSNGSALGYLCVIAGFLVIVASVVFVVKGKALLDDTGAPNVVGWGQIKANLTSAVALFVLGAAMVALPFWEEAAQVKAMDSQPPTALLSGNITGPGGKDVRLFLVAKPDYDQTYRGGIVWQFPLIAGKAAYAVIYTQEGTIIGEQPFSVAGAIPGSMPQKITLPPLDMQTEGSASRSASEPEIIPQLRISNEEVNKSLVVH
jgi:hypothetical protein